MPVATRLLLGLIGGVVVGAVALALVAGAIYAAPGRVRVPIGFFLIPLMGVFLGAVIGYNADAVYRNSRSVIDEAPINIRLWLAFAVLWMIVVVVVFSVFSPFGRYHDVTRWSGHDWFKFVTILVGPVVVGFLGVQLFAWATREPKHTGPTTLTAGERREELLATYQIVAKAVSAGEITPATGTQIVERHEELLQSTGDRKLARRRLADWLEQEAVRLDVAKK